MRSASSGKSEHDRRPHQWEVSGGGVLKCPAQGGRAEVPRISCIRRCTALLRRRQQQWPVVASVKVDNPALKRMGGFKADPLPVGNLAMYAVKAQVIFDKAGYR